MKNPIVIVILLLLVGGGAFFGGMKYQQSQQPTVSSQSMNGQRFTGTGGQQNGTRTRGGQVVGGIISQDDKSITVKLQDGSSKIVLFSDTTTISKATEGSRNDLKVGERVGVFGTTNSDGSVTAQNIQLNTAVRGVSTDLGIPRR